MTPHALLLLFLPLLFFTPTPVAGFEDAIGALSTSSRWIVDRRGGRVKLACANWAAHLDPVVAEGLGKRPADGIASSIRSMGFNCVRLTWPVYLATRASLASLTVDESLRRLGLADSAEGVAVNNPRLLNLTLIDAFKEVVWTLGRHNIMVILDNQISVPGWCCSKLDGNGFFGDEYFDPEEWIESLKTMASIFNSSTNVVGISLRNELRGPRQNLVDWYMYMQRGAEAVHSVNPSVLVIVSGLDYDKTLSFLHDKPLEGPSFKGKLVFELHWYGFSDGGDWENGNTNAVCGDISASIVAKGGFLLEQGWPLFLSEFGVDIMGNNPGDNHFLSCFLSVAAELDVDWAIWALQGSYYIREGRPNYDETYGVLSRDWSEPRNPYFLQRISAIQSPFQDPAISNRPAYDVIFHPSTGLCMAHDKLNGKPVLGSCNENVAWNYTSEHRLVLKDSGLCLQVEEEDNGVKFGEECKNSGSKWEVISKSGMMLSTRRGNNNGSLTCMDVGSDNAIVTSPCRCLAEEKQCSEAESQWFKIVYSNRRGDSYSSFPKLLSL